MAKPLRLVAAALVVSVGGFLAWPAGIDPVAWTPEPAREPSGAFAPNDLLKSARSIRLQHGFGAEGLAVASDGTIYGGTQQGHILRLAPDGTQQVVAETGGRPLGMELDTDGSLVVADAYKGLLRIRLADGAITVLTTGAEGVDFRFTDDLAIARDGTIYFSDASDRFYQRDFILDLLEMRPHGRLLRYDPRTQKTTVLARGLYFANGVALADDESFLVVNETWRNRVMRYWLTGEQEGELEPFIDRLPGFPDNVTTSPRGTFWVALYTVRKPILDDTLHPSPFLKKIVAKLPAALRPKPARHGYVLEVAPDGTPIRTLQDPSGESFFIVTSALERDGKLYVGSLHAPHIGVLELGAVELTDPS